MPETLTRRNFLKLGALSAAGFAVAGNFGENPPISNVLKVLILTNFPEILPTREGLAIKKEVLGLGDGSLPASIAANNLFLIRDKIFLTPDISFYPDMWFRDVYLSMESKYLRSIRLTENISKTFENQQAPDGHIPTTVAIAGDAPYKYSYDESTFLWLIKTVKTANEDSSFLTPERRMRAVKALSFTRKHAKEGSYVTPPGSRRGIVDAFKFPSHDVVTYLQGVYAASLFAADSLGLGLHRNEIKDAVSVYQDMMSTGIAPLSRGFDKAVCIGSLFGEYIAVKDFGEHFLTDAAVASALENAPRTNFSDINGEDYFKILTKGTGDEDFFDPSHFINFSGKGRYQNGAVWPLWDYIAKSVGRFHGLDAVNPDYVSKIQQLLNISGYAESIPTGGLFEKKISPEHPFYVWNIAVL